MIRLVSGIVVSVQNDLDVALIHYWLVGMRGGERVLESLCRMYPDADVYTHVYDAEAVSDRITRHDVDTTFVDALPFAAKLYQQYLPFMPIALEQLDLRSYDLVLSTESGPAKGVLTTPDTPHVCYCHTPMRYLWDLYPDYLREAGFFTRLFMRPLFHYLRMWDHHSADRVDAFVANSSYVARRIEKTYRRDAEVVHPPVDVQKYTPAGDRGDYFLFVGELTQYKRPDLAVRAFNRLDLPLRVVGSGDRRSELERDAADHITFEGYLKQEELHRLYAGCRALIFPGLEDFGIVPVEAMACGRPVIAYGKGGATDTVVDGETGLLFDEQTPHALADAVRDFLEVEQRFDPDRIRRHAESFDESRFQSEMNEQIARELHS